MYVSVRLFFGILDERKKPFKSSCDASLKYSSGVVMFRLIVVVLDLFRMVPVYIKGVSSSCVMWKSKHLTFRMRPQLLHIKDIDEKYENGMRDYQFRT